MSKTLKFSGQSFIFFDFDFDFIIRQIKTSRALRLQFVFMIFIRNGNIFTIILILIVANLKFLNCNSKNLKEESKNKIHASNNDKVCMPNSIIKTEGKKQLKKKRVKFATQYLDESLGTEPLINSNSNSFKNNSRKQRRNGELAATSLETKTPNNGNINVIKFTVFNFALVIGMILYSVQ